MRGCAVHYQRSILKLPLEREGEDAELWGLLRDAPLTVRDADATGALLEQLKAHPNAAVRNWGMWASRPIVRQMIFTMAYTRIGPDLLPSAPSNTNTQKSSYRADVVRCGPGTLLAVIEQHELMDAEAMARIHGMGSGGSEHNRPKSQQRRFTIANKRNARARDKRTATRQPLVVRPSHPDTDPETSEDRGDPQGGAGGDGPRRPRHEGAAAAGGVDDPPGPTQRSEATGGTGTAAGATRAEAGGRQGGGGAGTAGGGACAPSPTTPGILSPPVSRPALPPEASLTTAPDSHPAVPAAATTPNAATPTPNPSAPATQQDIHHLLAMVARQDRLLQSLLRDRNPQQGAAQAAGSMLSDAASSRKRQDGPLAGPA